MASSSARIRQVSEKEAPVERHAERTRREQPYGAWCGAGQGGIGLPCCPGCNADSQSCLSPACAPAVDQVDFACYTFKMCEQCTSHRTSGLPACACIKDFSLDLEKSRCQGLSTSPVGSIQLLQSLLGGYMNMPFGALGGFQGAVASGGFPTYGGVQAMPVVGGPGAGAGGYQAGLGMNGVAPMYDALVNAGVGMRRPLDVRQGAVRPDISAEMLNKAAAYPHYGMEPMRSPAFGLDASVVAIGPPQNVGLVAPGVVSSNVLAPEPMPIGASTQTGVATGPAHGGAVQAVDIIVASPHIPQSANTVAQVSNVRPASTAANRSAPSNNQGTGMVQAIQNVASNAASSYGTSFLAAARAEAHADVQSSLADAYREHATAAFGVGRKKRQTNQLMSPSMYDRKGCFQYRSRTLTELMHQRCWCPVFIRVKYICGYQQVAGSCKMTSNGEKCSVKYQVCNKLMSKNTLNAVNYSKCPSLP